MRRSTRMGIVLAVAVVWTAIVPSAPLGADRRIPPSPVSELSVTFTDTSRPAGALAGSRSLPTLVFYSTLDRGVYARNPLIVFVHGFGGNGAVYTSLLRQVAARGYVVAAPTFPLTSLGTPGGPVLTDYVNQPADVSFVITKMLELNADPASPLFRRIDPRNIGVSGHSLGAVTTLGFANTCCDDTRVDALAAIAGIRLPYPGGSYYSADPDPILLVHGDRDGTVPFGGSVDVLRTAPPPVFLVTLLGAGHIPFRLGITPPGPPPPSETVTVDVLVAFFDVYLHNGPHTLRTIRAAADEPGVATLEESLRAPRPPRAVFAP